MGRNHASQQKRMRVMNYKVLMVCTAVLAAPNVAHASEWWLLEKPAGASMYDANAFTACTPSQYSPAEMFTAARNEGYNPRIEEFGEKVQFSFPINKDAIRWWAFFRSKEACENDAQVRKDAAQKEKQDLEKFQ
jgi:hypothetical protein